MTKNEKKFYATNGVDWKDEESIMEFARQIWANFVAQSDFAGAENPEEIADGVKSENPD